VLFHPASQLAQSIGPVGDGVSPGCVGDAVGDAVLGDAVLGDAAVGDAAVGVGVAVGDDVGLTVGSAIVSTCVPLYSAVPHQRYHVPLGGMLVYMPWMPATLQQSPDTVAPCRLELAVVEGAPHAMNQPVCTVSLTPSPQLES
jgi:hypothetical protein